MSDAIDEAAEELHSALIGAAEAGRNLVEARYGVTRQDGEPYCLVPFGTMEDAQEAIRRWTTASNAFLAAAARAGARPPASKEAP